MFPLVWNAVPILMAVPSHFRKATGRIKKRAKYKEYSAKYCWMIYPSTTIGSID
jgi:hypothetical protein